MRVFMQYILLLLTVSFMASCASPKQVEPQVRGAVIHPKNPSKKEPQSLETRFRNETPMAKDKRECAAITFPEDDHIPPYSSKFISCMKERGWVPKKK